MHAGKGGSHLRIESTKSTKSTEISDMIPEATQPKVPPVRYISGPSHYPQRIQFSGNPASLTFSSQNPLPSGFQPYPPQPQAGSIPHIDVQQDGATFHSANGNSAIGYTTSLCTEPLNPSIHESQSQHPFLNFDFPGGQVHFAAGTAGLGQGLDSWDVT